MKKNPDENATAKDGEAKEQAQQRTYFLPEYGKSVEAASLEEAVEKVQKSLKREEGDGSV